MKTSKKHSISNGNSGQPVQLEGFAGIINQAHTQNMVSLARGGKSLEGWLEYPSPAGDQAVEWDTAPVLKSSTRVEFHWTCILGGGRGPFHHHLSVNGVELLKFETPIQRRTVWRAKGCALHFDCVARADNGEAHGVMRLTVPGNLLKIGKPARIRVRGGVCNTRNYSFFTLLNCKDTLSYTERERNGIVKLARAGKPRAVIIQPANATPAERFAAEELQRYIKMISGVLLPIKSRLPAKPRKPNVPQGSCHPERPEDNVILLGTPDAIRPLAPGLRLPVMRKWDGERIIVRSIPGILTLTGSSPRCVLFAVYRFLHLLGCRWFEPGPYGESVPRRINPVVGELDMDETPSFRMRTSRPTEDQYIYTAEDFRQHIDWAAKQGMNCFHFLIPAYERLRKEILVEMRKRDMMVISGGHTFKKWLPHELYDRHPEYFPEINGARIRGGSARCASNPAAVKLLAANAAKWAHRYQELDEIRIGCDDGSLYCRCAGCRKLRPVEQLQVFHNAAARAIHRSYPGKQIRIGAYTRHYEPPRKIRPYTRNVGVSFDTFARCQVHALNDPFCPKMNKQENSDDEPGTRIGGVNRYLALALRKWCRMFGNVTVVENVMLHARQSNPFPLTRVMATDLRYYKDIGVTGQAPQADLVRWAPTAHEHYVTARLFWNVEMDLRELYDEFYTGYYGKAARTIERCHEILEKRAATQCCATMIEVLKDSDVKRCRTLLDKAQELVATPATRVAVKRTAVGFEHMFLIWQLRQLHARTIKLLDAGRETDARRARTRAVECARALVRLGKRYRYHNIILFARNYLRGMFEECLNSYPDSVAQPRMDVNHLLKNTDSLRPPEEALKSAVAREKHQRYQNKELICQKSKWR